MGGTRGRAHRLASGGISDGARRSREEGRRDAPYAAAGWGRRLAAEWKRGRAASRCEHPQA